MNRCPWVDAGKPDYLAYHDNEWGVPHHDDAALFELLTLEGAQAGLSWYTVLRKRAHYREVFGGFDIDAIAACDEKMVDEWMENAGLIRHRQKLASTITNARAAQALRVSHGSLDNYFWSWVDYRPIVNAPRTLDDYPAKTALSDEVSKDLRKRGFKFVGSTIIYAFLQAAGLVNDHAADCFRQTELAGTR